MLPPFQRFFEDHRLPVHRYLTAAVGPTDADDCFQETFTSALRAYGRLDGQANLGAWVMTIARRKAIDAHRRRSRSSPVLHEPAVAPPEPPDGELWDAVRSLPPARRDAVLLRVAADLAYDDVARVLGCSREAARRRVHDGLKMLREVLS